MRIFLVRHAESKANVINAYGGKEVELTDNGIRQAEVIAKRFKGMDIEVVFCSRYKRAMQTARIMNGVIGKQIVYKELIGEWRLPSKTFGVKLSSKKRSEMWDTIYKNADDAKWHYSDAENVFEVMGRVKKFLAYLRSRREESILVVTHGAFIGVLLAVCLSGDDITAGELRKTARFFRAMNTGITELMMDETGTIKMVTFNDYAHLQ